MDDLNNLYGGDGYDKLEIFPGGLLEVVETGEVGPTFSCLIKKQFEDLKNGDRFFFTHKTSECHGFTSSQQEHLMKRTLKDVICDNTNVGSLQTRVMEQSGPNNPVSSCPGTSSLNVEILLKQRKCVECGSGGSSHHGGDHSGHHGSPQGSHYGGNHNGHHSSHHGGHHHGGRH